MRVVFHFGSAGTLYSNICCRYFFLVVVFWQLFSFYFYYWAILSLISGTQSFVIKASNSDTGEEYNEKIIASHMSNKEDFYLSMRSVLSMLWLSVSIWIKMCWGHGCWCFIPEAGRKTHWSGEIYLFTCKKLLSHDLFPPSLPDSLLLTPAEKIDFLSESHFRAITHMACFFSSASSHSVSSFF